MVDPHFKLYVSVYELNKLICYATRGRSNLTREGKFHISACPCIIFYIRNIIDMIGTDEGNEMK